MVLQLGNCLHYKRKAKVNTRFDKIVNLKRSEARLSPFLFFEETGR
jgi:hypothetical protein